MTISCRPAAASLVAIVLVFTSCTEPPVGAVGTPGLRAALFDTIIARVERREAFSEMKKRALSFDPLADMRALRDEVIGADTEEALFYALERLSNARRDRHLSVALVSGGLQLPDSAGLDVWGGDDSPEPLRAPIRVFPDYGAAGGYFVGDVADHPSVASGPVPGDRIMSVNGQPIEAWENAARPYTRHSSAAGLLWKIAEAVPVLSAVMPPSLRADRLVLEVEQATGTRATYELPWVVADKLRWRGVSEPAYPGMTLVRSTLTYDLYVPTDGRRYLVLVWTGFRETMVADVDTLIAVASQEGLLDHAVIVDVTRSGGGSHGPYAVQRLQPEPFMTTFGTLRLSDVIMPFIEAKRVDFAARNINDGGTPEMVDDGAWLMDWLETDVVAALQTDAVHTEPVPFKLAHASKDADGILYPSEVHFRGPFAVISGPTGGSHLDQFNAIVKDNGLGPVVGMPAGGYSNTWEWEEVLYFSGTDQPVVGFMYDIGFTIRPSGEVLEGNPANVDEWIPLTADGVTTYYARLLAAALRRIDR